MSSERNETTIRLPSGRELRAPVYPVPCTYLRIVNADGTERAYWDCEEWAEDPQDVMGAIVGAMKERVDE